MRLLSNLAFCSINCSWSFVPYLYNFCSIKERSSTELILCVNKKGLIDAGCTSRILAIFSTSDLETSFCPVSTIAIKIGETSNSLANSVCVNPDFTRIFLINDGNDSICFFSRLQAGG